MLKMRRGQGNQHFQISNAIFTNMNVGSAVEKYIIFGQGTDTSVHPLSQQLGQYRILRTSPLLAAPKIC
jgi:hypothetical protein